MKNINENNNSKLTILLTGPVPPPSGGIAAFCELLKSNVDKKKFMIKHPDLGKIENNESSISRIINRLRMYIRFLWHLKKISPSIVHINTASFTNFYFNAVLVLLAKINKKHIVLHMHGGGFKKFYKEASISKRELIKIILNLSDTIVTLSENWKNYYKKIIKKNNIIVIPNAINIDLLSKDNDIKRKNGSKIIISFLGLLSKGKGFQDILKAINIVCKEHDNCIFRFAGRFDKKNEKSEKEVQFNEFVEYFGEIHGESKKEFLSTSDIFILPSYAEGLPIAMLEAMAARLPLVVTPVGAISEVVKNDVNGYIIPVGDYKSLAEKILILANDSDLRKRIGKNNYEKIQKEYDIKLIIKKFEFLYESLMSA